MTPAAIERAQRVLKGIGGGHVDLTAVPSRRAHRQVLRAARDDGRVFYVKLFDLSDDFEREAAGYAAVGPDLAATLIVAVEGELAVVTEEVAGVAGPDLPPQHHPRMLTHTVHAFEQLLRADVRIPIEPIAFPVEPRFQRHLQRLRLEVKEIAGGLNDEVWDAQPLLPCHGDLTPHNVISSESGVKLIDFEFLGVGQPLYDAASLCLSQTFALPATVRLNALLACADAVAKAAGRPVPAMMLACAAGVWAVRCAAHLDDNPPTTDSAPTRQHPVTIASDVIGVLVRLPMSQDSTPQLFTRTVP